MSEPATDPYEHLRYRIGRMYDKLGKFAPRSVEAFRPLYFERDHVRGVYQDFRGGLSEDQIRGIVNELVFQIAHVKDFLKNWLVSQKRANQIVEDFINNRSEALQIIIDLANADKHGYPLSRPRSRHEPRLGEVSRPLRLCTGQGDGPSGAAFTYDNTGMPTAITSGGGSAGVVFSGDVLDKVGNRIGDVTEFASQAVDDWERLFRDLGL